MKKQYILLLFFLSINVLIASETHAQNIDPQYIFIRKDPMSCNPSDCSFLWNMDNPNNINTNAINDIFDKIGTRGNSANTRKIGIGVLFHYNKYEYDFNRLSQSLDSLLSYAKTNDIPIFITIEGFQWWDKQSNLWNWWDSSAPGYNPNNKNNVEWTCGDSSCAVDKAWRNWGSEFITRPHPNIASREFIEDDKQKLSQLLPKIAKWYSDLPEDKKWLFGGISLGCEVDIGGNFYYYPNGINPNSPNPGPGIPSSKQVGYAAIKTLNLPGGVTQANLNEVIRRYLDELNKFAFDSGIPRSKIFNHVGGTDLYPGWTNPPGLVFQNSNAAVTKYGNPGWSFYGDVTQNLQNYPGVAAALNNLSQYVSCEWGSPEWLTYATTKEGWIQALRNSLNYKNNRFINIANWEGMVRDKQYVLDAIKTVANENPSSCWLTRPQMKTITVNGNSVTLTWQKGSNNDAIYLLISTVGEFETRGVFTNKNIAQVLVTDITVWTGNNLNAGKYYWELVADGCGSEKIVDGFFTVFSPGDINSDYKVDNTDLSLLIIDFGKSSNFNQKADLKQDGKINIQDLVILVKKIV